MISFEEFDKEIDLRSEANAIATPCYICSTPHTLPFMCAECWKENNVGNSITAYPNATRSGREQVYKVIQELQMEQIAVQIDEELLR